MIIAEIVFFLLNLNLDLVRARTAVLNLRDAEVPVQTGVPGAVNPHKFSIG